MTLPKAVKFLAFGDTHCPLHDPDAVAWMLGQIVDYKPDVIVHVGDGFEADSASRWPSENDWTFTDELIALDGILKSVREVAPKKARLVFLPGNHDDNLLALHRLDPKVRDLLDWRVRQYDKHDRFLNEELFTHWERPAQYINCRTRGAWRIGQVTFCHGYECGQSAGDFESLYFGCENGLYIHGHTHRPHGVTQSMRTKIGEAVPLKSPRVGIYWSAEALIYRLYDEWAEGVAG